MDSSLLASLFEQADQQLDASGLACPLPLLKTKLALQALEVGQTLLIIATDAGAWRDIQAYTELTPHELLQRYQEEQMFYFLLQKGSSSCHSKV